MGLVLFVAASLADDSVEKIALEMLPFLLVEITIIVLITFVPAISLTLPAWLGFT